MKKFLALAMVTMMAFGASACAKAPAPAPTPAPAETPTEAPAEEAKTPTSGEAEIALITDVGTIDDKSFNQGSWEGVVAYATEKGITHQYYKPAEQSDDAYLSTIELAVKGGAKVIVTPGFLFEVPIFAAQDQYPDVKFILIDGYPNNGDYNNMVAKTSENTVGVKYAEEQSGFLAGYAAVKDGYTKLGFMGGMAVPAVVNFGYGFVQGAEYAAKELGLKAGDVTTNYHYTGGFMATPEAQALSASWYQSGVEVIFSCGGGVGNSVMAAAEEANGKVIGVDVDQYAESTTVITSAMKNLGQSVYDILDSYYKGSFPGGQNLKLDAAKNGVEISMENGKFNVFTQADYDKIFAELAANKITLKDSEGAAKPTELALELVKITEIQ